MSAPVAGGRVLTQSPNDAAAALRAIEDAARRAAEEARRQAEEARRKAEEARKQAEAARKAADDAAAKAKASGTQPDKDEAARLEGTAKDKEQSAAKLQAKAVLKEKEQALAQSKYIDATQGRAPGSPSQTTRDAQTQVTQARASVDFYEKPAEPVLTKPIDAGEFGQVRPGEGLDQFARRNGMTRPQFLALNPQFDKSTANYDPGSPPVAEGKRDLDGLENNEWLRVAPDELEQPAVPKPPAPALPTAEDVGGLRVDGLTLHESTMAALMKQYGDAPEGSDERRFAMLVRAQGAIDGGVQLSDDDYRKNMPASVVTDGVIDKDKVAAGLKELTAKPGFSKKFASDYQKELDKQFPKYFPNGAAPADKRDALWAGLTHGEGSSFPAYGQGSRTSTSYPLLGAPLYTNGNGLPYTPADRARGNSLIATTQVPGLPPLPGAGPSTSSPFLADKAGPWLANVQKTVPGSQAVVDPLTKDLSLEVVEELKKQAGQGGQAPVFGGLYGASGNVSISKLDAKLAADHPDLTPQQRADVIEQGYELLGISDRQAKAYTAAAAPYLEVRNVKLDARDQYNANYTQHPPQYLTLRKDAPQSAVDAWKALQNTTAMRGSLDPSVSLVTAPGTAPAKPNPALDALGSDDLKKAVDGTLDGKFTRQSVAQQYADYMTSPEYTKYLDSLSPEARSTEVQKGLLNIQAFDAELATKTADKIGNRIFEQTYAGVRPSQTDDAAGQAATYATVTLLRWSFRGTGQIVGSSKENWQAAGELFKLMKKVDAQGGDAGNVQEVENEINRQQNAGEISADDAKSRLQWVRDINDHGGWASAAGLVNVFVANHKFDDPVFRQKLQDGDMNAWMQVVTHVDIGLSYGEHYLKMGALAESKVFKSSHLADAVGLKYKGSFGQVINQAKTSFRPTMGEMSDALKGVDLTDKAAVQKALTDNMDPTRKVFKAVKYDSAGIAEKIATEASGMKLTPAEIDALKTNADARLGFLSMSTGEQASTPLGQSIAKQSSALVGVDLSDAKAVANALQGAGFGAQDADFIGQRIADTHASGSARAGNRFEAYGKLLNETYVRAPGGYAQGFSAASKAGDAAVLGRFMVAPDAAHAAPDGARALRYAAVPIKGAIAMLDVAAGPLALYFGATHIKEGLDQGNNGYIAAGTAEVLGAAAITAGGLAELGILASAAAGPLFIVGLGLTAVGFAIYELSKPSEIEQNTKSLQDYFRNLEDAGPGVLEGDWEKQVKEWSDANQTGSPLILAPGPLDGRPREPAANGVA
ncbi:hypothetical protein J7E62_17280 [Variovorax paradoxus]|nr:hypothetical protein [Variovorax paradoxus]